MKRLVCNLFPIIGLFFCSNAIAVTRYVPTEYGTIQNAINDCNDGDIIVVDTGTYYENINFNNKNIILTSTDPNNSSIVKSTIINGQRAGSVVTFGGDEESSCLLTGFTITNGFAPGHEPGNYGHGGGIRGNSTQATIISCRIIANESDWEGGGVESFSGYLRDCVISNNIGRQGGGIEGGSATFENCIISNNTGTTYGGGAVRSSGKFINCWVVNNHSSGGPYNVGGGGFMDCGGLVINCVIANNSANDDGGGMYECSAQVLNCTIFGNTAGGRGGGLCFNEKSYRAPYSILANNIIYGNSATGGGNQIALLTADYPYIVRLRYSNVEGGQAGVYVDTDCTFIWGQGCISSTPKLADPDGADNNPSTWEDNDFRLQSDSPCINAGKYAYMLNYLPKYGLGSNILPIWDMDSNCRLIGSEVDMGCYEHNSTQDYDGDLLADTEEVLIATDPNHVDSDGDSRFDGVEVYSGTDPLQQESEIVWDVPNNIGTIQEAIFVSQPGDEVVLDEGTYYENIEFAGKEITLTSKNSDDPCVVASTIIDGGKNGDSVIRVRNAENHYSVIEGLTIQNGYSSYIGGGIYCYYSGPTIQKNVIIGNSAISGGGIGLGYQAYCYPKIINNIICGNRASYRGAGIHCSSSTPFIANNTISANFATYSGSAISVISCRPTLVNCVLFSNTAEDIDKQLFCDNSATLTVKYCYIEGGQNAVYLADGSSSILNWELGNFDTDPCFALPGYWADSSDPSIVLEPNQPNAIWVHGDYHLKSETGRLDPNGNVWVQDGTTSSCIDAGDLNSYWVSFEAEPLPNSEHVNIGAYGGTSQASMSPPRFGSIANLNNDPNGNVNFEDFALIASEWLNSSNSEIKIDWVSEYMGPAGYPYSAEAIEVDQLNNVYVTGYSGGIDTADDYATIKYDPNGNPLWIARYDGNENSYDRAFDLAIDNTGNVYVTGYGLLHGTNYDYVTIKYDPNGNQLWLASYNGPDDMSDTAQAIVVDNTGNVYVTGNSYGSITKSDYLTIKYDPNGNELWNCRYNGPANDYDSIYDISVDSIGNVYVTGSSKGSGTNNDYATIKYDLNHS